MQKITYLMDKIQLVSWMASYGNPLEDQFAAWDKLDQVNLFNFNSNSIYSNFPKILLCSRVVVRHTELAAILFLKFR